MIRFTSSEKILSFIAVLSLIVAIILVSYDYITLIDRFPSNTYIGKVDVSRINMKRAIEKIKSTPISKAFEPVLYFNASGESFSYTPQELGIYIKAEDTVAQAFIQSHKDSYFKKLPSRIKREVKVYPLILDAEPEVLSITFQDIASKVDSIATDATIALDTKNGEYTITEDLPGRRLDIKATLKECRSRLYAAKNTFPLMLDYYEFPKVTKELLEKSPPVHLLSKYTTYYGAHDSKNRIHNIKMIADWINNTLMLNDEELSLLEIAGKFTPERGYKEAYVVIEGDKLEPQYGGGACQIGTTLYNTVALADIKVLSRRNHSLYFNIYPFGRDATIYPGSADFKLKNDTGHPILIMAKATKKYLQFRIYGTKTGKKVYFSRPRVEQLVDNRYVWTTKWKALKSNKPFRTIVKRTVYDKDGKKIKEENIKSFYKMYGDNPNVEIIRKEPR